mgnify:CR=1 FL=1
MTYTELVQKIRDYTEVTSTVLTDAIVNGFIQDAEFKILNDILADMGEKHDVTALLENIETYEEQYWVDRLARIAAIDILTIGKIQPDHMNRIAALNDTAFANCVKTTTQLAKLLNDGVVQAERQLAQDMVPQEMM